MSPSRPVSVRGLIASLVVLAMCHSAACSAQPQSSHSSVTSRGDLQRTDGSAVRSSRVLPGADVLLGDSIGLVRGRRVGLICNRASVLAGGVHVLDTLRSAGITVSAVFTPEHGFDADRSAGAHVASTMLEGIPVHSLYGARREPDSAWLRDIDVLVCDLQDVGARYYTYMSTMALSMRAAAAAGIPFVVLDRPNPVNGIDIEGPMLERAVAGFSGMFPIPARHGMTSAELARMIAGEGWLDGLGALRLTVVPMRGWSRSMWFDETGLAWIPPSPNIPTPATALLYLGTCLLEGTNCAEGRGTDQPFALAGAPFVEAASAAAALNACGLAGVRFDSVSFRPAAATGARAPRHLGQLCHGVRIIITERTVVQPVRMGWLLLAELRAASRDSLHTTPYLDALAGLKHAAALIASPGSIRAAFASWRRDEAAFAAQRRPYLLYP